MITNFNN